MRVTESVLETYTYGVDPPPPPTVATQSASRDEANRSPVISEQFARH